MKINHTEKKKALKIMVEVPESLKRADALYKERLAEIKEKERSGNWSPNALKREREQAKENYDIVAKRLIEQMKNAVSTISENNSFDGEAADFGDPKFQSALSFVGMLGHDMSAVDQINLLEQFRGNPGALRALGAAMKKNGLYFADRANEMCKTIPQQAFEDVMYIIGKYEYNGEVDLTRGLWTLPEFKKAAERYGYDMSDAPDPYTAALIDARDALSVTDGGNDAAHSSAARYVLDLAIRDIQTAKQTGDGNPEAIFTDAIHRMERMTAQMPSAEADA